MISYQRSMNVLFAVILIVTLCFTASALDYNCRRYIYNPQNQVDVPWESCDDARFAQSNYQQFVTPQECPNTIQSYNLSQTNNWTSIHAAPIFEVRCVDDLDPGITIQVPIVECHANLTLPDGHLLYSYMDEFGDFPEQHYYTNDLSETLVFADTCINNQVELLCVDQLKPNGGAYPNDLTTCTFPTPQTTPSVNRTVYCLSMQMTSTIPNRNPINGDDGEEEEHQQPVQEENHNSDMFPALVSLQITKHPILTCTNNENLNIDFFLPQEWKKVENADERTTSITYNGTTSFYHWRAVRAYQPQQGEEEEEEEETEYLIKAPQTSQEYPIAYDPLTKKPQVESLCVYKTQQVFRCVQHIPIDRFVYNSTLQFTPDQQGDNEEEGGNNNNLCVNGFVGDTPTFLNQYTTAEVVMRSRKSLHADECSTIPIHRCTNMTIAPNAVPQGETFHLGDCFGENVIPQIEYERCDLSWSVTLGDHGDTSRYSYHRVFCAETTLHPDFIGIYQFNQRNPLSLQTCHNATTTLSQFSLQDQARLLSITDSSVTTTTVNRVDTAPCGEWWYVENYQRPMSTSSFITDARPTPFTFEELKELKCSTTDDDGDETNDTPHYYKYCTLPMLDGSTDPTKRQIVPRAYCELPPNNRTLITMEPHKQWLSTGKPHCELYCDGGHGLGEEFHINNITHNNVVPLEIIQSHIATHNLLAVSNLAQCNNMWDEVQSPQGCNTPAIHKVTSYCIMWVNNNIDNKTTGRWVNAVNCQKYITPPSNNGYAILQQQEEKEEEKEENNIQIQNQKISNLHLQIGINTVYTTYTTISNTAQCELRCTNHLGQSIPCNDATASIISNNDCQISYKQHITCWQNIVGQELTQDYQRRIADCHNSNILPVLFYNLTAWQEMVDAGNQQPYEDNQEGEGEHLEHVPEELFLIQQQKQQQKYQIQEISDNSIENQIFIATWSAADQSCTSQYETLCSAVFNTGLTPGQRLDSSIQALGLYPCNATNQQPSANELQLAVNLQLEQEQQNPAFADNIVIPNNPTWTFHFGEQKCNLTTNTVHIATRYKYCVREVSRRGQTLFYIVDQGSVCHERQIQEQILRPDEMFLNLPTTLSVPCKTTTQCYAPLASTQNSQVPNVNGDGKQDNNNFPYRLPTETVACDVKHNTPTSRCDSLDYRHVGCRLEYNWTTVYPNVNGYYKFQNITQCPTISTTQQSFFNNDRQLEYTNYVAQLKYNMTNNNNNEGEGEQEPNPNNNNLIPTLFYTFIEKKRESCRFQWLCTLDNPSSTKFSEYGSCNDPKYQQNLCTRCANSFSLAQHAKCMSTQPNLDGVSIEVSNDPIKDCSPSLGPPNLDCSCEQICRFPGAPEWGLCSSEDSQWKEPSQCAGLTYREVALRRKDGQLMRSCPPAVVDPITNVVITPAPCGTYTLPSAQRQPKPSTALEYCRSLVTAGCTPISNGNNNGNGQQLPSAREYQSCHVNEPTINPQTGGMQGGGFPVCDEHNCGTSQIFRDIKCLVNNTFFLNDFINAQFPLNSSATDQERNFYNTHLSSMCNSALAGFVQATTCHCPRRYYCTNKSQVNPNVLSDFTKCFNEATQNPVGFPSCALRCEGDITNVTRNVYCRQTNGTLSVVTNPASTLGCPIDQLPPINQTCPGTLKCGAEWFCAPYNTTTLPGVIPIQPSFTHGEIDPSSICHEDSHWSNACFVQGIGSSSGAAIWQEQKCIIPGETRGPFYRRRNVQCIIYDATNSTTTTEDEEDIGGGGSSSSTGLRRRYPALPPEARPPSNSTAFCLKKTQRETTPLIFANDTLDYIDTCEATTGCTPRFDNLTTANNILFGNEGDLIEVNWSYVGPKISYYKLIFQYAMAYVSNQTSPALTWHTITQYSRDMPTMESRQWFWTIPNIPKQPMMFTNKIFLRAVIGGGEGDDAYFRFLPGPFEVDVKPTCADMTCIGSNLREFESKCIVDPQTAEPRCNCITPSYTPSGGGGGGGSDNTDPSNGDDDVYFIPQDPLQPQCERTNLCDVLSAQYCVNGGFLKYDYTMTSNSQCSTTCTCPGGQTTRDCSLNAETFYLSCPIERRCNVEHGRYSQNWSQCGCERCYTGWSGETCNDCVKYAHLAITYPSTDMMLVFNSSLNWDDPRTVIRNTLIDSMRNLAQRNTNWDLDKIQFDEAHSGVWKNTTYNVTPVLDPLPGEPTEIITVREVFDVLNLTIKFIGPCDNKEQDFNNIHNQQLQMDDVFIGNITTYQSWYIDSNGNVVDNYISNSNSNTQQYDKTQTTTFTPQQNYLSFDSIQWPSLQRVLANNNPQLSAMVRTQRSRIHAYAGNTADILFLQLESAEEIDCKIDKLHISCRPEVIDPDPNGGGGNSPGDGDDKRDKISTTIIAIVVVIIVVVAIVMVIIVLQAWRKQKLCWRTVPTDKRQVMARPTRANSMFAPVYHLELV